VGPPWGTLPLVDERVYYTTVEEGACKAMSQPIGGSPSVLPTGVVMMIILLWVAGVYRVLGGRSVSTIITIIWYKLLISLGYTGIMVIIMIGYGYHFDRYILLHYR